MRYWIVWRLEYKDDGLDYILGIYIDEVFALKACNKQNKISHKDYEKMTKKDIIIADDKILNSYDNFDNEWRCSRVSFKDELTRLYFICIIELGEAENYGNGEQRTHACSNKKTAIKSAVDYFDNEHDRDSACENCGDDNACKKELIKCLKKHNKAEIECINNDSCPYSKFDIFRVNISKY